jgi:hypothetical protein
MRTISALALTSLLVLFNCASARADDWSHDGTTWTHASGIYFTVPDPFQATQQDHILTLSAENGADSLTFVAAHGKTELSEVVRSVNQTLATNKAVMKAKADTIVQNDVEIAFKEGDCTLKGVPFDITVIIMGHGDDFLVCQLLIPRANVKTLDSNLNALFNSIGYRGAAKSN